MSDPHHIFIISGPSGSGKGTIINGVLNRNLGLVRGINVTTRDKGNRDKGDDHFQYVTEDEFHKMCDEGEICEKNFYQGNWYGTNGKTLKEQLKSNDVLMEVDVNGAEQITKQFPSVTTIFVNVGLEHLKKRLIERRDNTNEEIAIRLKTAEAEFKTMEQYDYVIENPEGKPDQAVDQVVNIINTERAKL